MPASRYRAPSLSEGSALESERRATESPLRAFRASARGAAWGFTFAPDGAGVYSKQALPIGVGTFQTRGGRSFPLPRPRG
jgi:hypothetical protein